MDDTLGRGKSALLPGVSLLLTRPGRGHYVFSAEAEDKRYVYSVLRVGKEWTAMGGKVTEDEKVLLTHSEQNAEAFSEMLCLAEGRYTRKEAKQRPDGKAWYFHLNATDLRELGAT